MNRHVAPMLTVLLSAVVSLALNASRNARAEGIEFGDPRQNAIGREIKQAYDKKDYVRMTEKSREYLKLAPNNPDALYNLANAQVLLGKNDDALASLRQAADHGFGDSRHLEGDQDFAGVHDDKRWTEIVSKVKENAAKDAAQKTLLNEINAAMTTTKDYKLALQKSNELVKSGDELWGNYCRAEALVMLNQKADAVAALDRAITLGYSSSASVIEANPIFKGLKTDKQFALLMQKVAQREKAQRHD